MKSRKSLKIVVNEIGSVNKCVIGARSVSENARIAGRIVIATRTGIVTVIVIVDVIMTVIATVAMTNTMTDTATMPMNVIEVIAVILTLTLLMMTRIGFRLKSVIGAKS